MAKSKSAKRANSTFSGETVIIGKGIYVYPHLNTPDDYENQIKYKCGISIPKDQAQGLMKKVKEFAIVAGKELGVDLPKCPWSDDEEREGNIVFTTKCDGEYAPKLYDASGKNQISREIPIWGGTVGKLRATLVAYKGFGGGVSLRLKAAQILELKSADSGFDAEDGYVAPEMAERTPGSDDDEEDEAQAHGSDDAEGGEGEGDGEEPQF